MRRVARAYQTLCLPITAICGLFFATSINVAVAADRVMMGTPSHGLFEFPVVVAMRKGYFTDEGFDVRKIQIQPQIGVKALVSGDIAFSGLGFDIAGSGNGRASQSGGRHGVAAAAYFDRSARDQIGQGPQG